MHSKIQWFYLKKTISEISHVLFPQAQAKSLTKQDTIQIIKKRLSSWLNPLLYRQF